MSARQAAEEFLMQRYQFFLYEFVQHMVSKGYSSRTALNWLYLLSLEGKVRKKMHTRKGTLYESLLYNNHNLE